jgi:8-oxo-dGTP pyrophosphatase MutT (NUDIX family)
MSIGRFFAGIGALVWCVSTQKYLVLRRSADKDFGGGAWECVTGRVDQGEGFTDAALREAYEELGVHARIDFIMGTMHFYRGEATPENEMVGVQFCCSIETPEAIKTSWEHAEYRWVTAGEAQALFPEGHWLGKVIQRAEAMRALMPPKLLDYYRVEGFES